MPMYTERVAIIDETGVVRFQVSGVDGDGDPWTGIENVDTTVEYPIVTPKQIAEALLGDA